MLIPVMTVWVLGYFGRRHRYNDPDGDDGGSGGLREIGVEIAK